ncbi:hypothetical protein GJR96_06750 [Haloferax sp. MBLA0076]|uniref:Uncharacterized protein n=1 Tax=Haloferax litoreum TaxID=2666140 RepID=A0A6A8GE56_9EURY|nr:MULTISPECIES: hypothetical protein [Haloferax]KAB1193158.1 hypothetical protein Hfx1148_06740 [Haloferax sp. CBA1148]MRX21654.1 hypothetical protein [Haloferax litoreum]
MTQLTTGRLVLVVLAVVGLAFSASVVSAHGTDSATDDTPPYDGTADEWTAWMETHMAQHMGPGAVEWMESHMGVTVEEMGQFMAEDGPRGPGVTGRSPGGMYGHGNGGMYGSGGGMYGGGPGC